MAEQLIRNLLTRTSDQYPDVPAVEWAVRKNFFHRTYGELAADSEKLSQVLASLGLVESKISLIGATSYEWITSYMAIVSGRDVAVPLDAMLPAPEQIELIQRSDSEAVFLSAHFAPLVDMIDQECPKVKYVFFLQQEHFEAEAKRVQILSFGELLAREVPADLVVEKPLPDDVATFIYTSGTTGKSKGVMLTQRNQYDNVVNVPVDIEVGTKLLSVLPIHHAFCLTCEWLNGFSGGATICINDSLLHMVRNMAKFSPKIMLMVPLMVETIYKRLQAVDPSTPKDEVKTKIFGPDLTYIYVGGAHLDPFYIDKFEEYGIHIYEGYGMSECSPVISNQTDAFHRAGSVGKPLPNVEIGFDNGEVLVRGSSVMKGYYQMPKETSEALVDGWLHTGDLGHLDEDGFLYLTGRIKNLIILSNGENVSPEEIEGRFARDPMIAEVIVAGEKVGMSLHVYPDPETVAAQGLTPEQVQEHIRALVDDFNKSQPTYRALTKVVIRKTPFIKSSTKKIVRKLIDQESEEV